LIEPMDMLEIRFAHGSPTAGNSQTIPPILMRGFVSTISRSQSMSQDGHPQRNVIVNGQDYGKIWQQIQILYFYNYIIGEDIISAFQLFERFGVGFQTTMTGSDFISQVIEKIVNPYLAALLPAKSPLPASITMASTVQHGTTSISGEQNAQGSIYEILRQYTDVGAWNELYVEDREDGVYCVYRPNPSRDLNGQLIQSDATDPGTIDVLASDIMSISVSRTDANVANFYWVRAPRFDLVSDIQRQLLASTEDPASILQTSYENSQAALYGIRPLYADTQMGGDGVETLNSGLPTAQQTQRDTSMVGWVNSRRAILLAQNKDNVVLESGTITMRGREDAKAGMTLRVTQGRFIMHFYIVEVAQNISPFNACVTTLSVERGDGFVQRVRRGSAQSPYLQEQAPLSNV